MTKRALALHLLREAGERGVTTGELLQAGVGSRYGARILELREQGHAIESVRLRDGAWRYTLVESVVEPSVAPAQGVRVDDGWRESLSGRCGVGEPASLFSEAVGRKPVNAALRDA